MPDETTEIERFRELQEKLAPFYRRLLPNPREPQTVVVIPGISLDPTILSRVVGIEHYEERLLCMLMLLRRPQAHLIYVTSVPIDPVIIAYYLNLLQGIPGTHARRRLSLFSCHDGSPKTLAGKILERPRLLARIRSAIADPDSALMTCFNATAQERTLALRLGIPLYACDPELRHLGSKSGSREIFRAVGLSQPLGFERLRDEGDIAEALAAIKRQRPEAERAVVKLEEGTSGEGNALFRYGDCPMDASLAGWIRDRLADQLHFEWELESWEEFIAKWHSMGGVAEEWIARPGMRSPSMQGVVNPLGEVEPVSTHDQVLGGSTGQVFQGCTFPADPRYRLEIQAAGLRIGEELKRRSALGRYGVDFITVPEEGGWKSYAVEINLRRGGTTHPFLTLEFLTDGRYDEATGRYLIPTRQERCYFASDNLKNPNYRRLTPEDLIDVAVEHDLHFHGATQGGVVFHLMGAISEFGKLGVVCIAETVDAARALHTHAVEVLDRAAESVDA